MSTVKELEDFDLSQVNFLVDFNDPALSDLISTLEDRKENVLPVNNETMEFEENKENEDGQPDSKWKKSKAPVFMDINEEEKGQFLQNMKNKNTEKKTESCHRQFQRWLSQPPRNETRDIWIIPPTELDNYVGSFLLSIRKSDGSEYEPDSLTSYHRGIDR